MTEPPASQSVRTNGRIVPPTQEQQAQHGQVQYGHAVLLALLTFAGGLAGPGSPHPGSSTSLVLPSVVHA
jgi:hypothetical protein